jgi:hypothetical protein
VAEPKSANELFRDVAGDIEFIGTEKDAKGALLNGVGYFVMLMSEVEKRGWLADEREAIAMTYVVAAQKFIASRERVAALNR